MCNRFGQGEQMILPGMSAYVLRKRGGGYYRDPARGIYSGAAKKETLERVWIRGKQAEHVLIPHLSSFEDYHLKLRKQASWALPPGMAMEGVLLPEVMGKNGQPYRLLKVVTRAATPEEEQIMGNDRMPVVVECPDAPPLPEDLLAEWREMAAKPPRELKPGRAKLAAPDEENGKAKPQGEQLELF